MQRRFPIIGGVRARDDTKVYANDYEPNLHVLSCT